MHQKFLYPMLTTAGALAVFALRLLQNRNGFEAETGLQISGSPFHWILLALLLILAVVFLFLTRKLPGDVQGKEEPMTQYFQASSALPLLLLTAGILLVAGSGILELLAAVSSRISGMSLATSGTLVEFSALFSPVQAAIEGVLTVLAAAALFPLCSVFQHPGEREVNGNLLLLPAVAAVIRLVLAYRTVSINPVLASWYVEILALAALILSLFWLSSFAFGDGRPRRYVWMTCMAILLCAAALADCGSAAPLLFYGGMLLLELSLLSLHLTAIPEIAYPNPA